MYIALDDTGKRVHAYESIDGAAYTCPCCGGELVRKYGLINRPHFAHKTLDECDPWYTQHKTEWHIEMQRMFPANHQEVPIEISGVKHISDVRHSNRDTTVFIEMQHSGITASEIAERTDFYLQIPFSRVWWLFDARDAEIWKEMDLRCGLSVYRWRRPMRVIESIWDYYGNCTRRNVRILLDNGGKRFLMLEHMEHDSFSRIRCDHIDKDYFAEWASGKDRMMNASGIFPLDEDERYARFNRAV